MAQARQRKAANLSRQENLKTERKDALGDPVRGIETPFLKSFDTATPVPAPDTTPQTSNPSSTKNVDTNATLNHFLKPSELQRALQHSYILTQPLISTTRDLQDPAKESEEIRKHAENHDRAAAAVARIVDLANGNSKDRTRANIQRCIETFGRHNTDSVLRPKPPSLQPKPSDESLLPQKKLRAGPDTGSSEVQVAILTAKIRVLADNLQLKGGQKDKANKRNLRLLVHRRQKLLAYLQRKERGGERWQNLIQTLGLTEGTWKGEISL